MRKSTTTLFGREFKRMLVAAKGNETYVNLAKRVKVTPAFLWLVRAGQRKASARLVDRLAEVMGWTLEERIHMHRMAARDMGFKI